MKDSAYDLIIIGAGASGLMAAQEAAALGLRVLVLEGKPSAGAKILMSGGGRSNVTNAVVSEKDFGTNHPRTVKHVLKNFTPDEAQLFFAKWGAPLKLEDDGKYFAESDAAKDVLSSLLKACAASDVTMEYSRRVVSVSFTDGIFGVEGKGFHYQTRSLLVSTGGLSFPATGSDGFGFALARQFGHAVVATRPALVPLLTDDRIAQMLSGLSLRVRLTLWVGGKKIEEREGDFLFTHQGFSGPVVFDMSRAWLHSSGSRRLTVDFSPDYTIDKIESALMDDTVHSGAMARLSEIIPKRLVGALLDKVGADGKKAAFLLTREERKRLLAAVKAFELPVTGTMGYDKAEVTAGGVDLRELKGATLESKLQPGLFFAGEVLDVDGRVGGFNLHWAWASGIAAARGIVKKQKGHKS